MSSSGLPGISPTHLTVDRRAVPSRRLALMKRSTTAGACSWSRTARQDVCRFRRMAKGIRSSLGPMPGVVLLAPVAYVLPGHRCYIRPTEPPVAGHRVRSPVAGPSRRSPGSVTCRLAGNDAPGAPDGRWRFYRLRRLLKGFIPLLAGRGLAEPTASPNRPASGCPPARWVRSELAAARSAATGRAALADAAPAASLREPVPEPTSQLCGVETFTPKPSLSGRSARRR